METIIDIVNDDQLNAAFGNANFGEISKRDVVRYSLLKFASGYSTGHTAKCICEELGLITTKDQLSNRGKRYLFLAFYDNNSL